MNSQPALARYLQQTAPRNEQKHNLQAPVQQTLGGVEENYNNDVDPLFYLNSVDLSVDPQPQPQPTPFYGEAAQKIKRDIRQGNEDAVFEQLEVLYRKSMTKLLDDQRAVLTKLFKGAKPTKRVVKNSEKFSDPNYGFKCPLELTNAACEFLGEESSTKMSRPGLAKAISSYIKENNLKDQTTSMIIIDDNLSRLFGLDNTSTPMIKYQDINKYYLSRCFTKHAKNI